MCGVNAMMNFIKILLMLGCLNLVAGCGDLKGYRYGQDSLGSSGEENLEPQEVPSIKVVAVVSQNQILPNFQNCLKIPREKIRPATRAANKEVAESFAQEGEVEKISAPMLMAVTRVVSEICLDLITHENTSTARTYFEGFDLNGTTQGTGDMDGTLRKLASSCWGREITETEKNIVKERMSSNTALNNKTNRDTALFSCTSLLSSSQAIKF